MRFLADMGISPRTVAFLCELGHDAVHLHEQGLDRLADAAILEKARLEHRVLLTHDLDFAELVAAGAGRLPSVVIFRLTNMQPERVNQAVQGLVAGHRDVLERGAVVSVAETRVRVRLLPLRVKE